MSETIEEKKCKECGEIATQTLRQHAYCTECFREASLHLFRATFGKHRVVRDGEKVLVAVSGGPASLAMLALVTWGLKPQVSRKLRFTPLFFHLDESELLGGDEVCESARAILEKAEVEYRTLRYKELLPNSDQLLALLKQRSEPTARFALHDIVRRRALLSAARRFDCSRLLIGDCGSRIAARALEEVLQGRGGSVGAATAFLDNRFEPSLLRPMLELSSSECASVALVSGLTPCPEVRGPFSRSAPMATLQGLTARVLRDLEPSFPATNFAIVRTAGKLETAAVRGPSCVLCESAIDWEEEEAGGAVGDLRFCHERATGREVFREGRLCYGCHVLTLKHDQLKAFLSEEQDSASAS